MESSKETGCQAPEGPILCINNCGFFGSAATMNMCSKCHKEMISNQQQQQQPKQLAVAPSVDSSIVPKDAPNVEVVEFTPDPPQPSLNTEGSSERCSSCNKRVGLLGFNCRCGSLFCSVHRYSDKHSCPFDYRAAARDSIAKANPLVKAKKLEKI